MTNSDLICEGRSKRLYRVDDEHCLIELVPTLDSFTFNRHEVVEGTDSLRLDFYELVVGRLHDAGIPTCFVERTGHNTYLAKYCRANPFEVIVKNYATGSTTRKYPGLFVEMAPFHPPVVKFDYRIDPEDQPIADDYLRAAGHEPDKLKWYAQTVNSLLRGWLAPLVLVDVCFTVGETQTGDLVLMSEISPDCMRLRSQDGQSWDKDLFRQGASHEEIVARWTALIDLLKGKVLA